MIHPVAVNEKSGNRDPTATGLLSDHLPALVTA
jgi:hypothetical protein